MEDSYLIRPFRAIYPHPDWAQKIVAPPYDVVEEEEISVICSENPLSFLTISRPEVFHRTSDPYSESRRRLRQWLEEGKFLYHPSPAYYLYGISCGGKTLLGVAGEVSIAARLAGRIRPHEETRPEKVRDRLFHLKALEINSGPTYLLYRSHPEIRSLLTVLSTTTPPLIEVQDWVGATHSLWVIPPQETEQLDRLFRHLAVLYIADGHHRSYSALLYWKEREGDLSPLASEAHFLGVLFPSDEVQILPYHRFIKETPYPDSETFLAELTRTFNVTPKQTPFFPEEKGTVGVITYARSLRLELIQPTHRSPWESLDSVRLHRQILEPYLRISNPREDTRIHFFGGVDPRHELKSLFSQYKKGIAFTLYPPSVEEMMRIVDAGGIMPPKSTWFHPKLLDGLVLQPFSSWIGSALRNIRAH